VSCGVSKAEAWNCAGYEEGKIGSDVCPFDLSEGNIECGVDTEKEVPRSGMPRIVKSGRHSIR
jgi:hypothetical protein